MSFNPANITALVIAASFAAGLNIYATVLALGIAARAHVASLPPGLDSLGHTWIMVTCGILFAVEFIADKIPGLDLVWNALHTVVRIPIAGLIAYHATMQMSPGMQVLATTSGAAIALLTHTSKTAVRAAVTPSPEPVSNIALSTAEDITAVGLTWFATHHPISAAVIAVGLLLGAALAFRALVRAIRRSMRRLFGDADVVPTTSPLP